MPTERAEARNSPSERRGHRGVVTRFRGWPYEFVQECTHHPNLCFNNKAHLTQISKLQRINHMSYSLFCKKAARNGTVSQVVFLQ